MMAGSVGEGPAAPGEERLLPRLLSVVGRRGGEVVVSSALVVLPAAAAALWLAVGVIGVADLRGAESSRGSAEWARFNLGER